MDLQWNLHELFSSEEECFASFAQIDELIVAIKRFKGVPLTAEAIKTMLSEKFACQELAYRVLVYGSLRFYADAKNEKMIDLKREVEKKDAEVTRELAFIDEALIRTGEKILREYLQEDEELSIYRQYIDDLLRRQKHAVISDEKTRLQNEIGELQKKYNDILANTSLGTIFVDGQEVELTHGVVPKYLASRDHETRKAAFEALNRAYQDKAEELAAILNAIYHARHEIGKIEGYASVKESALDKENIAPQIIDNLIEAVHQNIKYLKEYMTVKAKYMQLEKSHLYDLGVPFDFDKKRRYPIEEGLELARNAFKILGDKYLSIIDELLRNGHIDAIPNEAKHQTITFSWLGYSFLNYHDSYNDLKNLVHEIGHSVNDSLSMGLPFPYRISSLFAGETASITNEILLNRSLLDQAKTTEERCFYLSKEIDNFITSVYRQTMYTELENILYDKVACGETLDAKTIGETYMNLLKFYYGDDIEYDELCALEWTRLGKLYRWAFYFYNYATGLLIAASVYSKLKDGSLPVEDYIVFLASGSKEYSLPLLETIGIDLSESTIWDRGFEVLKGDIEELSSLICEQKKHTLK